MNRTDDAETVTINRADLKWLLEMAIDNVESLHSEACISSDSNGGQHICDVERERIAAIRRTTLGVQPKGER